MTPAARKALDELDPRQRKAAIKHASGASITEAMRHAGYSEKYLNTTGPGFLQGNARFTAAVQAISGPALEKALINADRTIEHLAKLGYADVKEKVTNHHKLRALDRLARIQKLFEPQTVAAQGTVINIVLHTPRERAQIMDLIPEVGGTSNPQPVNGAGKHNGTNGKG